PAAERVDRHRVVVVQAVDERGGSCAQRCYLAARIHAAGHIDHHRYIQWALKLAPGVLNGADYVSGRHRDRLEPGGGIDVVARVDGRAERAAQGAESGGECGLLPGIAPQVLHELRRSGTVGQVVQDAGAVLRDEGLLRIDGDQWISAALVRHDL